MMILDMVEKYYNFDHLQKTNKRERDILNQKLKDELNEGLHEYTSKKYGKISLTKSIQERTSMDNDKTIEILKKLGHTGAIKTVEIPDKDALNDLIFQGLVTPDDLSEAVTVKEVEVLKIKRGK